MTQLAAAVPLNEVDLEVTLLGSLFLSPESFPLFADEIAPEWFSDQFLRYLFEATRKLHETGNRISHQAIIALMPEDCGGISRSTLYQRACAAGIDVGAIGGLVTTLKDRWARRRLVDTAELMKFAATRFDADPYETAGDAVLELDTINASRSNAKAATLAGAATSVVAAMDQPAALRGASTGILALDNKLNGYKAGQLYVIAGRPGMGKSAFMCSSLRRTAETGHGVAIFSLEMGAEEIAARCLSDAWDHVNAPTFGNILKGLVSEPDRDHLRTITEQLQELPLYIDDSPRLTMSEITGRARRARAKFEAEGRFLSVICIDHMGLVTPSDRYRGNKVAEAGEVSAQARALAKELDCCVVLLCQLSREVEKREDKRPVMADLRWSGEIEQDAHVVAFLYREAYYLAQDAGADPYQVAAARNRIDFLIRKNRNGETADIRLWCSIGHSSVRDEL